MGSKEILRTCFRMGRKNEHEYYLDIAERIAERSTCRRKVGTVIVSETGEILSTGYNGSISKAPHCEDEKGEDGCLMVDGCCIRTVHSELNALMFLKHKEDRMRAYTTVRPCINCFKALLQAGVKSIYYREDYRDEKRDILENELQSVGMLKKIEFNDINVLGGYKFSNIPIPDISKIDKCCIKKKEEDSQ